MIDRLSVRERPRGCPVLHQRWSRLVFLHWRFPPEAVRPLVPSNLALDLFDGAAWVGMTPFTVSRMRPTLLPSLPVLSDGYEINLRTYVQRDGIPGLWFLSLDATNSLAVWGARVAYRLPYYRASMRVMHRGESVSFQAERTHGGAPRAMLDAAWETGDRVPDPRPDTLEFFLIGATCSTRVTRPAAPGAHSPSSVAAAQRERDALSVDAARSRGAARADRGAARACASRAVRRRRVAPGARRIGQRLPDLWREPM